MTDPKTMSGWRSVVILFVCAPDRENILRWLAQAMAGEDVGNLAAYNKLRPLQRAWVWEMRLRKHIELLQRAAQLKEPQWEQEFEYPRFEDLVLHIGGITVPLDFQDMPSMHDSRFFFWADKMRNLLPIVKMVPLPAFQSKYASSAAPAVKQEESEPPEIKQEEF